MNTPKRRIRQTVWGNWYGYLGNRKVEAFANSPEGSAEDHARKWLETGDPDYPKASNLCVTGGGQIRKPLVIIYKRPSGCQHNFTFEI